MINKKSLKTAYRFIDIVILFFLIFDFGFNVNDSYKLYKLAIFFVLTSLLIAFNVFKFYQFPDPNSRKTLKFNLVLLIVIISSAGGYLLLNDGKEMLPLLKETKVIFEVGLLIYLLFRNKNTRKFYWENHMRMAN
jgi:trk system potassium uptake protein TrkH